MKVLALRRCNRLPTDTCVLCYAGTESCDHLFFQWPFAGQVWGFFVNLLNLPEAPRSMDLLWGSWRAGLCSQLRFVGEWIAKAIVWNIWLARNDSIFNASFLTVTDVILKCARMTLSWFSAIADGSRETLVEPMNIIRRNLVFSGQRLVELGGSTSESVNVSPAEEAPVQSGE